MGITERKEREKEHRREEIIDAAQTIFFQKGLQLATMDEIAEAAELSKGTLYLYYKSKEDLYLAVLARGMDILYDMFSTVVAESEPIAKKIAHLLDAYLRFFKEQRNYFRMFFFFDNPQVHKQVSEEMLQACATHNMKVWNIVIGLIREGIEEGVIDHSIDPKQAAVILWASSSGLMRQMDREDHYWSDVMGVNLEEALRRANAMILASMMTEGAKTQFREAVV